MKEDVPSPKCCGVVFFLSSAKVTDVDVFDVSADSCLYSRFAVLNVYNALSLQV